MGQQATTMVITDVLPGNVTFVPGSATGGGVQVGDVVRWSWPVLEPGGQADVSFQVTVGQGSEVVNALYGVRSAEGVIALGPAVVTPIKGRGLLYLPLVVSSRP
jgi:hypothetical protein